MLKYLFDGGIFMWVILLASISGLAVIIEKMYTFLSKEKKLSENEKNQLYKALNFAKIRLILFLRVWQKLFPIWILTLMSLIIHIDRLSRAS